MSLHVYLTINQTVKRRIGIPVRVDGRVIELTPEEYAEQFPGHEPIAIEEHETNEIYNGNITHNLATMAREAGLYDYLWRPDEIGITKAEHLIEPLRLGMDRLVSNPEHYQNHNPENGWGTYEGLIEFVRDYLLACEEWPDATVTIWR